MCAIYMYICKLSYIYIYIYIIFTEEGMNLIGSYGVALEELEETGIGVEML